MKRIIGLLAITALLVTPTLAFASGQAGVYVAPKFVYGFAQLNGMKTLGDEGSEKIGNKSDSAWGGALAVGYDFYKQNRLPVRAELEYAIFSNVSGQKSWYGLVDDDDDTYNARLKQRLQVQTLFVNTYYDFHNDTPFTPWLGAGLGMAVINSKGNGKVWEQSSGDPDVTLSYGSKLNTNFAWNVGAGVAYAVNEAVSVDLGYRFAGLGKAETKWRVDDEGDRDSRLRTKNVYMHQVMLGLRFSF